MWPRDESGKQRENKVTESSFFHDTSEHCGEVVLYRIAHLGKVTHSLLVVSLTFLISYSPSSILIHPDPPCWRVMISEYGVRDKH